MEQLTDSLPLQPDTVLSWGKFIIWCRGTMWLNVGNSSTTWFSHSLRTQEVDPGVLPSSVSSWLPSVSFFSRALGSGCPQCQTNAVSMRRPAQLETGWSHLGHQELGSWSLLVPMGGAGQKGQGGHVLRGDSERNENFKRKSWSGVQEESPNPCPFCINFVIANILVWYRMFLEDQQMFPWKLLWNRKIKISLGLFQCLLCASTVSQA